jgi:co-chaperonin GroES (HSP10)
MIKPLGNMLLITKIDSGEKTTKTGLVISSAISDTGPKIGEVIAKGDGESNYKGEIIPIHGLNVGDLVYYLEHSGTDIEDEERNKYLLINYKNILAVKER